MVQLENCIKFFNKIILDELESICTTWVAGGAVRDYFSVGYITSDIDLYFANEKEMDKCYKYLLEQGAKKQFENEKVYKLKYKGKTLDVIKTFFASPEETIKAFDFTVCCAAVSSVKIYTNPTFFIDLAKKQLMINSLPFPVSTMWRMQKYIMNGYRICKGEMSKLIDAIQDIPIKTITESYIDDNQNNEDLMESYDESSSDRRFWGID